MKETQLTRQHSLAASRGWIEPSASRSFSWVEDMQNASGTDITEGAVVVVLSDGTIELADTVNDPRPTGVALDDIDDDDTGQVCFGGPVDLVQVTASVTAGQYGQTSTTPGEAQVTTGPATAFCMFTDSGTTPSAFLWGGRGGGGVIAGVVIEDFSTDETDTSLELHPDGTGGVEWVPEAGGGASPAFDHGNMGATETLDLADGTWHRGTLDADCTVTVTGFTVDEGLVVVFEVTQDGTGGWDITWDPDVVFIGDDQPDQTAGATTVFLLFSSAGDSLIYGAKVGQGISASSFATPSISLGTAAAAGAATTVIRSDSTIAAFDATVPTTEAFGDAAATGSAAVAARRDHKHGMPTTADVLAAAPGHVHVAYETHTSDGSTTTFTLDQFYEPGSVQAWNRTTGTMFGVTEVLPDQATLTAAGTAADLIDFFYAASVI